MRQIYRWKFHLRKMNILTEFWDGNSVSNQRRKDRLTTSVPKFEMDFDTELKILCFFFLFCDRFKHLRRDIIRLRFQRWIYSAPNINDDTIGDDMFFISNFVSKNSRISLHSETNFAVSNVWFSCSVLIQAFKKREKRNLVRYVHFEYSI